MPGDAHHVVPSQQTVVLLDRVDQPMIQRDAVPDQSTLRLQILLAARGGCRDALASRAVEEARSAATHIDRRAALTCLTQIDDDPFPAANPLCRPYEVVLEVEGPTDLGATALVDAFEGIAVRLADLVHADLSGAIVGAPQFVIPCEATRLRYLYLMRRRAGTSHETYIDYYFNKHSRFGFATPAIAGYTQFHVDQAASADASRRLGVGAHDIDSVSELHLDSLEEFFAGIGDGRLGAEAAADEELFVDRANSVSFCTTTRAIER